MTYLYLADFSINRTRALNIPCQQTMITLPPPIFLNHLVLLPKRLTCNHKLIHGTRFHMSSLYSPLVICSLPYSELCFSFMKLRIRYSTLCILKNVNNMCNKIDIANKNTALNFLSWTLKIHWYEAEISEILSSFFSSTNNAQITVGCEFVSSTGLNIVLEMSRKWILCVFMR